MTTKITTKPKLNRRVISLGEKLKILDRLKSGDKIVTIAKEFNLNESTIRTIKKSENKIKDAVSVGSLSLNKSFCTKNFLLLKTESNLLAWIDDCCKNNIRLSNNIIRQKAKDIYANLKEIESIPSEELNKLKFAASKGWFNRFKTRYSLNHMDEVKFDDINDEDSLDESTNCNDDDQELDKKESIKLEDESSNDESNSIPMIYGECGNLTLQSLKEGLELAKKLETFFTTNDPSKRRSTEFKKKLQDCLAPYLMIKEYLETNNETVINVDPYFFD